MNRPPRALAGPDTLDELMPDLVESPDLGLTSPQWRNVPGLVIPLGTVDRPREQRRDTMTLNLTGAAGHVAVVGGPRSGKSTMLRSIVTSMALVTTPLESQFFVLDFGGGTFAPLSRLPHVSGVATRSEPDVVRHFTRLSTWNYAVDLGLYPLGSCTMKYNPKLNEKVARLPGFAETHPLQPPERVSQSLPLASKGMLLPLRRRQARIVVHVVEQHLDRPLHVGEGDLVAEPEVPLVVEVTAFKAHAQLGDEGAEVSGGHARRSRATYAPSRVGSAGHGCDSWVRRRTRPMFGCLRSVPRPQRPSHPARERR